MKDDEKENNNSDLDRFRESLIKYLNIKERFKNLFIKSDKYTHFIRNKEKIYSDIAKYRAKNRSLINERSRKYRDKNKEKIAEQRRLHRIANRDDVLMKEREYGARKRKKYKERAININNDKLNIKNN